MRVKAGVFLLAQFGPWSVKRVAHHFIVQMPYSTW